MWAGWDLRHGVSAGAMTTKAAFNAEEWATLVQAPMLAAMRVVAATRGGTIRESFAVAQTYAKARQQHGASELLDEVVASPPALDAASVKGGDIAGSSDQRLREAAGLVQEKATPEEAESYKQFVLSLARAAAEAHREGGILGMGGQQVSPDEQKALDEIAQTLGVPAS
jgi:hypothetical protein